MPGARNLSGQALATLGAAGGQDAATTDGGHAGAEAVTAFADQFAGLIRAFHVSSPLSKIKVRCIRAHGAEVNGPGRFLYSFFAEIGVFVLILPDLVVQATDSRHIQGASGLLNCAKRA